MSTTRKKQIFKAMKFEPLKTQNFETAKLNGFTVLKCVISFLWPFHVRS